LPEVHQEIAAACVVQTPSGFAVMPARWARRVPGMQDLPHCGAGDRVAEFDEFALHATVPPRRIVGRDAA
jgi:hypothetical protein